MRWSEQDEELHIVESIKNGELDIMEHTSQLYQSDRTSLLRLFQQFRASNTEDDGDCTNRDQLEQKLLRDGMLDGLDLWMLQVAVVDQEPDPDQVKRYMEILGE